MGRSIYICVLLLLFVSCQEENPTPQSFLEYDLPFHQNVSGSKLKELDDEIRRGSFGDIHSVIIIRNDKLIFENYYSNYDKNDLHSIGSSTQSVITAVLGSALHEDTTLSIDTKIVELLPDYTEFFENVPQKDQIEVRHLLSNTSGLWWDEWTHPFGSEDNDAYVMSISADWISTVLSTPMIREPGYEFNYNSGNGILMAPVLRGMTGMALEQFAKEKLFIPLSIHDWKWEKIPGEEVNAAWGLHLRPLDMAKIGYLFLKEGIWNDHEIFDERWQGRSTRSRITVSNLYNYAFFWWKFTDYADTIRGLKSNDLFFSWGDGGQFIFVIPHLDVVVVSTAGNYANNDIQTFIMLRDFVIAAVADRF